MKKGQSKIIILILLVVVAFALIIIIFNLSNKFTAGKIIENKYVPLTTNNYCGDDICNENENCNICSQDCGRCSNRYQQIQAENENHQETKNCKSPSPRFSFSALFSFKSIK